MSDLVFRRANRSDLPAIIALLADDEIGRTREDSSIPSNANYEALAPRPVPIGPRTISGRRETVGSAVVRWDRPRQQKQKDRRQ
jgi:hypothetical protein